MTYASLKGIALALFGNGWKSVSVALALTTAGLFIYSAVLKREINPYRNTATVIEASDKEAIKVGNAVQITAVKAKHSTEKITHVLQKHQDWADQPVPRDVVVELCLKVNCTKDASAMRTSKH